MYRLGVGYERQERPREMTTVPAPFLRLRRLARESARWQGWVNVKCLFPDRKNGGTYALGIMNVTEAAHLGSTRVVSTWQMDVGWSSWSAEGPCRGDGSGKK